MPITLLDNRQDNPYYEIIHNFLNRQLSLIGNCNFLNKSIKSDLQFMGNHMLTTHPRTREHVFFSNSFEINESNKDESFSYLINYFTLSTISQSFEAFEAFMKDVYRKNLSLNIRNEGVLNVATKAVRGMNNNELRKILQTICPSLGEIFNEDNSAWLRKIELIRHCIVHNDQTISPDTIEKTRNKFIDTCFTFKKIANSENRRIFVEPGCTGVVFNAFQNFSFSTFVLMSENDGYPVALSNVLGLRTLKDLMSPRNEQGLTKDEGPQ